MTVVALINRRSRKFLLVLGIAGLRFLNNEALSGDCSRLLQTEVGPGQSLTLLFNEARAAELLAETGSHRRIRAERATSGVIYSYGGFTASTGFVRSNRIELLFKNPFADLAIARTSPF